MRCLFISHELPYPPDNGVRNHTYSLLQLVCGFASCDLITFTDSDPRIATEQLQTAFPGLNVLAVFEKRRGLSLRCHQLMQIMRFRPWYLARWNSSSAGDRIRYSLRESAYDIVHLDGISMGQFLNLTFCKVATVFSPVDAVSLARASISQCSNHWHVKLYEAINSELTKKYERLSMKRATITHVVSQVDAHYLGKLDPRVDVRVIGLTLHDNIVDATTKRLGKSIPLNKKSILIWGNFKSPPVAAGLNCFVRDVYPLIQASVSDVQLTVWGMRSGDVLRSLNCSSISINSTQWVDDATAMIRQFGVIVFPDMGGTGLKTRVLFAMVHGLAIVATKHAVSGFSIRDGQQCLVRNKSEDIASAVITLLQQPEYANRLGTAAQDFAREEYSSSATEGKWRELYLDAMRQYREN